MEQSAKRFQLNWHSTRPNDNSKAIVEYFIDFRNKQCFLLAPSPPIENIAFLKVSLYVS